MPSSVDRDTLERYALKAQEAIDRGIDKDGVQALRLKAIKQILGKGP